jgi:hypothetical protein
VFSWNQNRIVTVVTTKSENFPPTVHIIQSSNNLKEKQVGLHVHTTFTLFIYSQVALGKSNSFAPPE